MFGFLYSVYLAGAALIDSIKGNIYDFKSKERWATKQAIGENPYNIYFDRKGAMRDLVSGNYATIEKDNITGDVYLCEGLPSRRFRNLSAEWRKLFFENERENRVLGRTVCPDIDVVYKADATLAYDHIGNPTGWRNSYYAYGQWYRDLDTEDLYVCRRVRGIDFYMDVRLGKLVRITDKQKKIFEENPQSAVSKEDILLIQIEYNHSKEDGSWNEGNYRQSSKEYWETFYLDNRNNRAYDDLNYLHDMQDAMGVLRPIHPSY